MNRNFPVADGTRTIVLLVVLALVTSRFGDHLEHVALTWNISQTNGLLGATAFGAATAVPAAVFGILGGSLADRFDKVRALMASDLCAAVLAVAVGGVLLLPTRSPVGLIAGGIALTAVGSIFTPVMQALMPELVGGNRSALLHLDAALVSGITIMAFVGPAVAGLLVTAVAPSVLMFADAATFIVSAAFMRNASRRLVATSVPCSERRLPSGCGHPRRMAVRSAAPGVASLLLDLPLVDAAFGALPFLFPAFVRTRFHGGSAEFGLLIAANAVGRLTGSQVLSRSGLQRHRGLVLRLNFVLQGLCVISAAFARAFPLALVLVALAGLPSGAAQLSMSSYIQLEVNVDMRGRVRPGIQRLLDAMTDAPAWVRNDRLDFLAANRLGFALYSELFTDPVRPANNARFAFLNPRARDFYDDWNGIANDIVAVLRSEAGRNPYDRSLTELIGELSTRSEDFRSRWAAHDVRFHRTGAKTLHHPIVGELHLSYEALELPGDPGLTLLAYTAEPGSTTQDALDLLASWSATDSVDR